MLAPTPSRLAAGATLALAFFANTAVAGEPSPAVQSKQSTWMASSIMSRRQGIMTGKGGSSELLQAGVTQKALTALAAQYPDDAFAAEARAYIRASAASVVPFTLNATHDALSYPLDRLSNGNALLALQQQQSATDDKNNDNQTASFRAAADALRQSIDLNRRNPEGGLWYFVYPEWSYLDGMYSLAPFYTLYSLSSSSSSPSATTAALNDMYFQLDLLWNRTRHAATGLLVHGYDASRTAVWADPDTGASPHVWGRSLGWYAMAVVDTLEALPRAGACRLRGALLAKYRALAAALVRAADPATGAWWQLLDEPAKEANYLESSGSAMFAYALLKGARLGYLGGNATLAEAAAAAGVRGHGYLARAFVVREANGTLGYNGTVSVCSLNSTASYEYYVKQPISYNNVLGAAAYVLASLEVERLGA